MIQLSRILNLKYIQLKIRKTFTKIDETNQKFIEKLYNQRWNSILIILMKTINARYSHILMIDFWLNHNR